MFYINPNDLILIANVIGALIAIWAAIKWVFRPILKFIFGPIIKVHRQIDFIAGELKNNGGGSLRDIIQSIGKKLTRLERRQHSFLNHSNQMLFETDSQGRFTWISDGLLRALNVSEGDMLLNAWKNSISFEDQKNVLQEWNEAIKDGRNVQIRFRFFSSDGKIIPVYCEGTAQKDDDGSFLGFVGSITKET